ncbi:MAG: metalloregulator ArsR/SmtB family transcription factor [Elusimicrobiota bacterium]
MKVKKDIFEKAKKISRILDCISSPIRLMILCMLIEGEKNVSEILEKIGTTKGNMSQHLRILTENALLDNRREGNKVFYFIKDKKITRILSEIKNLYCPDLNFDL